MYNLISRDYQQLNLSLDSNKFVRNCYDCIRNKTNRLKYKRTLKLLPVLLQRQQDISVDFIGSFIVNSLEFNGIIVTVDRLSKERYYTNYRMDITTEELAHLFIRDVQKLYSLLETIVSDRGNLFVSEFQKTVYQQLRVTLLLSSSYYPESDG